MNCRYCETWNAEEEHRCCRCGRRLKTPSPVSPAFPATRSAPALALQVDPASAAAQQPVTVVNRPPAPQSLAFHEVQPSNIIPFESFAAHRIQPLEPSSPPARQGRIPQRTPAADKTALPTRSTAQPENDLQPGLDFFVPAPQGPRTLETQVEAVIYCDAPVAKPKHRAVASAVDGGMIFTGFGVFLVTFHMMGGMFHLNRQTIPFFIGVFGTLALFYSLLWAWSGRDTLGMRWTKLRLVDFDGLPANRRDRLLRLFGACLSCCAAGAGLLWALVDEEKLTWHDHISKTFPTIEESNSPFWRSQ